MRSAFFLLVYNHPAMAQNQSESRSRVVKAAYIVGGAFIVSRILGFVREYVVSAQYGTQTIEVNAYSIANLFPETIFFVVAGGAMASAYLPTFTGYFAKDDEGGAWHLFSGVVNLILVAVTMLSVIAALLAPWLVELFYPELVTAQPEIVPLTVRLIRVMLISTVIFGASGVVMATLNARQHFLMPALAPVVYNLGIIFGAVVWAPDVSGLAYGAVLGALGHLLVQVPAWRQHGGRYRPVLTLRDPGIRQVLVLMGPRVLGLSFSSLNRIVMNVLSGALTLGSIRATELGFRLMLMPISIIGQALGTAAFPTFAELAARQAIAEMRRILVDTIRLIFFIGLPITVILVLLSTPIVELLLDYGVFEQEGDSLQLVSVSLALFGLGLVALSAIEILSRAFYALEDTWTPVIAGAFQIGLMLLLGLWLSRGLFVQQGWLPLGGIALGASLANWLEVLILVALLRRKLRGINGPELLAGLWRMTAAAAAMTAVVWLVLLLLGDTFALIQLLLAGGAGGAAYLAIALALRLREPVQLASPILRRMRR